MSVNTHPRTYTTRNDDTTQRHPWITQQRIFAPKPTRGHDTVGAIHSLAYRMRVFSELRTRKCFFDTLYKCQYDNNEDYVSLSL